MFGERVRELRERRGMTLAEVAARVPVNKGHLSRVERGERRPTDDLARRIDQVLDARGDLIALAHLDSAAARDAAPWQTADLLRRLRATDAAPATLDALQAAVVELCCEYGWRDARALRAEGQEWLREVARLLHEPVGLREHRELLVAGGWLALLIGCVEYDLGMRAAAEATRVAASQLGHEADHSEIIGWAYEMSAWFSLTQGRYAAVLASTRAGQRAAPGQSAAVQLAGQEAKALARLGDISGVRAALDRGRELLDALPYPERPDNHFVVDPAKWDFYAMDAYRLAGADELAGHHAREVLQLGAALDGTERSPMRMAEARLTLAAVAARSGELEQAVSTGVEAFRAPRRSLPSLLMVAGEVDAELHRRYPTEAATGEFRDVLRTVGSRSTVS